MRIAIAGPISVRGISHLLEGPGKPLPVGNDGAPLLTTLITALMERGHTVSAYTLDKGMARHGERLYQAMGSNGLRLYVGPYRNHAFRPNGGKPGRMLDVFRHERRSLCNIIELDRPDVIHAHWTYEYALAALDSGLPSVITAHDSPRQVLRFLPNAYRLGRYFMARSVYRRARVLTAVSPYLRDQVQRYARTDIRVIGNPVPYQTLMGGSWAQKSAMEPHKPGIVMVLNGWGRRKNATAGLRAFALLREQCRHAALRCYGADYGPGEKASRWAAAQGLDKGVEFIGMVGHDELLARLRSADILLHPALEESFGLSILEAMALGVPVIGGENSGGVPWVLDQGRAGLLCDVRSPEAMSRAMISLIRDPDQYRNIQKAAGERISDYFTPQSVIRQYEAEYKKALDQR